MNSNISRAIESKNLIEISYVDKKGNRSERVVEPYEIKQGRLFAYCLTKDAIRGFTLSALSKITVLEDNFNPRY